MTECNQKELEFPGIKVGKVFKKVNANFEGGEVSSDGGVVLLGSIDRQLGLTKALSKVLRDDRNPFFVAHTSLSMLRQRVYGLCLGYEDINDQQSLRFDSALQSAIGQSKILASPPTLSRFENRADRSAALGFHIIFVEQFIRSFKEAPEELVLDFDATDDLVHGKQEGRFFHGYYENYCFLPLYVFCKDQLLVSYLRPSNIDGAKHTWAIMALLYKRLRQAFPGVKITFRGDSGFCRQRMFNWFEKQGIGYITGIASNKCLSKVGDELREKAKATFESTGKNQKLYAEGSYAAKTWKHERRIIVKAEYAAQGDNTRYVVTNLEGSPEHLYKEVYCKRGDMENRIKEQQLGLFADRTSCKKWWSNQLRLLLSSSAYILMETLRRLGLKGTQFEYAQVGTLRTKLLKIGAVIIKNTRRIKIMLSENYPYQELFKNLAEKLSRMNYST